MTLIISTKQKLREGGWLTPTEGKFLKKRLNDERDRALEADEAAHSLISQRQRMQARIDSLVEKLQRLTTELDRTNTRLSTKEETNAQLHTELDGVRYQLEQAYDRINELVEADPMAHAASTYLTIAALENSGEDINTQVGVDWTVRYDHETGTIVSPTPENSVIPLDWGTWIEHKTSKEDAAKIEAAVLHLAKDRLNKASTVPLSGSVDAYVCKLATTFDDGITVEY